MEAVCEEEIVYQTRKRFRSIPSKCWIARLIYIRKRSLKWTWKYQPERMRKKGTILALLEVGAADCCCAELVYFQSFLFWRSDFVPSFTLHRRESNPQTNMLKRSYSKGKRWKMFIFSKVLEMRIASFKHRWSKLYFQSNIERMEWERG